MAYTVSFRGPGFSYRDYVYFLDQVEQAKRRGETRIEADFRSVEFCWPDGMAPFVAAVGYFVSSGLVINVALPLSESLVEYWQLAGWLDGIKDTGHIPSRGHTYVPLTPYSSADEIHAFLNGALDIVSTTQAFSQGVLNAFEWSFYEISDNVLLHSDTPRPAWLQLTSYPDKQQVEFVIVDTGQGIRASLSEFFPDLTSDQQAVELAVQKETTRNREIGQGNGLSGTVGIATGANGWMNLHSGHGQLRWLEDQHYTGPSSYHPGTLVTVTLPTHRPLDISAALWGHVPVSGLEMRYVTGEGIVFVVREEASNFGNRHTGERLRIKLGNLAEMHPDEPVVVDFDGIEVMSASFADEFVAKLVKDLGVMRFFARYRLSGLSDFTATMVDQVIAQRLAVK